MLERGMIFNGEMVRAILDGRKTQTRRIMAPQPADDIERGIFPNPEVIGWKSSRRHKHGSTTAHFCHYGKPGDRIWVRETWGVVSHAFSDDGLMIDWVPDRPATAIHEMPFGNGYYSGYAIYAADGDFTWGDDDGYEDGRSCWKPSIHMPKAASRILLEITDVRVERLNAISEEDAQSEGVHTEVWDQTVVARNYAVRDEFFQFWSDDMPHYVEMNQLYRSSFRSLWSSIYGDESWKANPWVWVISFERVEGGAA
ncbi:hypothetical protein [Klebsiella michiganensis]|uniref:hypothetical protein n=1 Tax=Klebsiella michiganensis TaxID=1134687 RepID=UPI000A2EB64A|nr:hypothetical protein [Klebsiella michiganensis]OSY94979.1 hypothetical protein BM280_08335 [Klebsiella michiganensis]